MLYQTDPVLARRGCELVSDPVSILIGSTQPTLNCSVRAHQMRRRPLPAPLKTPWTKTG